MGWTGHDLEGGAKLFVRDGLSQVFVETKDKEEIPIPRKLLEMLVAAEIRAAAISHWENVCDAEVMAWVKTEGVLGRRVNQ